ncbi:hypothetical protein [Malonomonas rubra]|uniref:hypothetical protein n=1 Tax=Malonomonas rubra TaxID=57040 RepID=UPI0026EA3D48|nr:hypothetical protein [Malonomonas rubra]
MGYSYVGTYLYISEEKQIYNDSGYWLRFLDFVYGIVSDIGKKGLDGVEDHGMDNYLAAIKSWDCSF